MKKLFSTLILMLFCLVSLPVMAAEEDAGMGFWFEARTASGSKPSEIVGYYERGFTDTFGVYVVAVADSSRYREVYAGPTWNPTKWLQVGIGFGREITRDMPNSPRRNAWVAIETDKVSAFATYENGGSGPWHKAYVLYKVTESVSAGVMNETFLGRGLRVEYTIAKKIAFAENVTIWGALLHDRDTKETTSLLAVNFSF